MPDKVDWLVEYCSVGPRIAEQMEKDAECKRTANEIMKQYLIPAKEYTEKKEYQKATAAYCNLIAYLERKYRVGIEE